MDLVIIVVDASNLRRNLLYATQVIDLGIRAVVALTMVDISRKRGVSIDSDSLSNTLGVPVIPVNARTGDGVEKLDMCLGEELTSGKKQGRILLLPIGDENLPAVEEANKVLPDLSDYGLLHILLNRGGLKIPEAERRKLDDIKSKFGVNTVRVQSSDIKRRYERISSIVDDAVTESAINANKAVERLDRIFLHGTWGYLIMLSVLFIMFQAVFLIAEYPMTWIESAFGSLASTFSSILPDNWFGNLIINGLLAGIGGILVFVPQIMILFGMISFLEDTGYMARIGFLTDRLMRKVGLNGKSVMPMISGFACAVPAIMSARNIENKKERLLTILATPLMSCSARLPVFTVLVGLVIPKKVLFGFLNLQGLVMLGLYMLGLFMALFMSWLFNLIVKITEKSVFILEMPLYRPPRWKNILLTMVQKARIFVFDAGKVIMVISLVLWALSYFGPTDAREALKNEFEKRIIQAPERKDVIEAEMNAQLLENSYAGVMGRWIEPIIAPLGFDWKIGIALITSLAAREVFVGTMATLYSVGADPDDNGATLREKMSAATRRDGTRVYDLATGVSLMIFYVFAMQCMSTLAVVKKETGGWKWPSVMFVYMTALAYMLSMLSHWLLSGF